MAEGYLKQLVGYIKKNLAKGYPMESLKWALINQGYSRMEVLKAIERANQELALEAPKFKEKPVIKVETEPEVEEKKSFWSKIKSWFS
jgi:hypothetical protein